MNQLSAVSSPSLSHFVMHVLQDLGADEVINYKEEDFAEKYKDQPFDMVIDPIGGALSSLLLQQSCCPLQRGS